MYPVNNNKFLYIKLHNVLLGDTLGVDYYGVLYEDENTLVVVPLGSSIDPTGVEKSEWLLKLVDELDDLLIDLNDAENVTSFEAISALTRIAKLVERGFAVSRPSLAIYGLFCKYFDIAPRVLTEFEVYPEDNTRRKRVIVLGRE